MVEPLEASYPSGAHLFYITIGVIAMEKLRIQHNRCPGDVTVLTALIRDLAKTYPGRFAIDVETNHPAIWENNPYITKLPPGPDVRTVVATYGQGLREQNHETIHFCAYFHRDFERQTGIPVKLLEPKPDLHLTQQELDERLVGGRYWVVIAGGKNDFPVKIPSWAELNRAITHLRKVGVRFVQAGSNEQGHIHPPLDGVLNLVGKTSLRQFIRLLAQADGVICPNTAANHIAAALEIPRVVLSGGREAWYWHAYVRENSGLGGLEVAQKLRISGKYLHTLGLLDCCRKPCWVNKLLPDADKNACKQVMHAPGQIIPRCMAMLQAELIVEAVAGYYADGVLPPLHNRPAAVGTMAAA